MPRIGLASLALALAVALAPARARACSCAALSRPTLERCRTATRVFAGTVDAYAWPLAYRASADDSVEIHLGVDTVWRGAVPPRLVVTTDPLGGPGSCSIAPRPGQRFLVCDSEEGGAAPALSICVGPALGEEAEALRAALGPGAPPSAPTPARWPWWTDRERLAGSAEGLVLLAAPFVAALVGAGLGALVSRRRPVKARRGSMRRLLALLVAAALLVIGGRLALHHGLPPGALLLRVVTVGPSVVAGLFGAVLAFHQARRRGLWGLTIALVGVAVALAAGYARLHAPVQPADAVACSEARAREHLRALARPVDHATPRGPEHEAWERGAPAACTDWGLSRMQASARGPTVGFPDGRGGMFWVYDGASGSLGYTWELP